MRYRFVPLDLPALEALAADDLATASRTCGVELTPWVSTEIWLWRIRRDQVRTSPEDLAWVARPAVALDGPDAGRLVGHLGYHAAPDVDGRVEVGYTVDPAYRRRGHARAMLVQAIAELEADPRVRVLRASISPDNAASLGTIAGLGFEVVGEQWDEDDGLEVLHERPV